MRAAGAAAVLAALLLAGCGGKGGAPEEEVVPDEITQRDVERLEGLVSEFPREFHFPGQAALEAVHLVLNGTVEQGTGMMALEVPNDDGYADYGAAYIPYDLAPHVPVGQPVEVRIKLKWYGDPGSSADLDIWVNVPGTRDAYTPDRFDESLNWNIVTKVRVVNAVRVGSEPFEVGLQVSNGKDIHPDGIRYTLTLDLLFPEGVLAPGVPYALEVPEGSQGLIFESEPILGDEHIDSEVVLVDPDGLLAHHFEHNDIVTETLFVPIAKAGTYVVYAPRMHGGFLRVQADVPNPDFEARLLEAAWQEAVLAADVALSPAVPGLAMAGTFDTAGAFPLDIEAWIRPVGDPGGLTFQASLNITSGTGWVTTAETTAGLQSPQGRLGTQVTSAHDRSHLASGAHDWLLTGSGLQDAVNVGSATVNLEAGYRILTVTG